MSTTLKLAICFFPEVTALDYKGPMELFGFLSQSDLALRYVPSAPYGIKATYVAYTKDPLSPVSGPRLVPDTTYEEAINEQFDILLIPGGKYLLQISPFRNDSDILT